ncbi:MAG: AMP-dependent synthetase [Gammaproteobacteria bacterium GWF2_41_13]|nr:MAG: AMP-dependent synthetase [Gammaproteobacteria bacterium GWF2_41_13]
MNAQAFIQRFQQFDKAAIVSHGEYFSYAWLSKKIAEYEKALELQGILSGAIVQINADFSPYSVAMLFALANKNCIVVPMTKVVLAKQREYQQIVGIEHVISFNEKQFTVEDLQYAQQHDLLMGLKKGNHPGLIIMSSGSSGTSKAVVHDLLPLLDKFEKPRHSKRILTFLLFDHIGGINTLFYTLYNGGCIIVAENRTPDSICYAIEQHRVQILPTTPTFINLLLLSQAYKKYDLSALELVTYGTEIMPESVLQRFHQHFPEVRLQQTYGLSELGILRSKSKSSDSLLMKIGGEGFEIRVVDGLLEIKAKSAMLGYLNAPSPFTEDGWLKTGDAVEVEGEYLKILGRKSEMINVGGEKVYPAEIENVLLEMNGVEDVLVVGEPNAILGNIVKVKLRIKEGYDQKDFKIKLRIFCKDKLPAYKIPQKIEFADHQFHGARFKKMRNQSLVN